MITLNIEDYCHNCPNFEPEVFVEEISYAYKSAPIFSTKIFCKKRETCVSIYESIKKEMNANENYIAEL